MGNTIHQNNSLDDVGFSQGAWGELWNVIDSLSISSKQDGQINGIRDSNWKTITKKHRFSNDTRALEKYYFQFNKVCNFLPVDPADMI